MKRFYTLSTPTITLILILGLFTSSTLLAQANKTTNNDIKPLKQYDIEIILFKNIKTPKGREKTQPSQAPYLDEPFISFNNPKDIASAAEPGFVLLEDHELQLTDIAKKIDRSSRYQILQHLAWRQPGLAKEHALPIQIRAGKQFGNDYSSIDPPVLPATTQNIQNPEKVWYELEGKITITLARYLHTYIDVVLRIPSDNDIEISDIINTLDNEQEISLTSATLNNYSFKEHRRMRSKRLHYLDHPEMGMLILITPYTAPQNSE